MRTPPLYSGDREVDVAMTEVFGGFGRDFYKGEKRRGEERYALCLGCFDTTFSFYVVCENAHTPCSHQGYEGERPLSPGFEKRKVVYNL